MLTLLLLFFVYAIILQRSISDETQTYLSEIASQSKNNIKLQLQGRLDLVRAMGTMIPETALEAPQLIMDRLDIQQDSSTHFKRFGLVFKDGTLFTTDGTDMPLMDRMFVHRGLSGETAISEIFPDPVDNEPVHIFYTPLWVDNSVKAVLFAMSGNSSFQELLHAEFFNNTGYIHLVHKNGNIIQSSNPLPLAGYTNLFDMLGSLQLTPSISPPDLLESLRQNESGRFNYTIKDERRYVYYTPLDVNSWYLITSIPAAEIDRLTIQRLAWTFTLVVLLMLLLALLVWRLFHREKGYKRTILAQMEELRTITANIPGGVQRCRHDEWMTMDYVSDGFVEMVGYPREELQKQFANKFLPLIHSDDLFPALRKIDDQLSRSNSIDLEYRIIRSDGTPFWAHQKGILVREGDEELLYCVLLDETEVRTALEIVQMDAARYGVLFKLSESILFEFDMRSGQISTSPKFAETFGYDLPESNFPQSVLDLDLVHPEDIEAFTNLFERLYSGHSEAECEMRVSTSGGEYIWCKAQVMGIMDQNQICSKAIGKLTDIDAQMHELVKLKEEVQRDPFTQLYNKVATETLARESIDTGTLGALFLIDVDNFKRINDELGHAFGDTVLLTLASRLQNLFRRSDIVGRIGGDEFAVYLQNISDGDNLFEKADAICRIFSMPVGNDGATHTVSGSVGVACFPSDAKDYGALFAKADKALYESKHRGKNCFTFFSATVPDKEEAPLLVQKEARYESVRAKSEPALTPTESGYDPLTGVPLEELYESEGTRLLAEAASAHAQLAVLAIKVEGLHQLNSLHGYAFGDSVLCFLVKILKESLPPAALFGRCRGNDFAAMIQLPGGEPELWFGELASTLVPLLETEMPDAALAWVKLNIGVSLYPAHGATFEEINRKARQAVMLNTVHQLATCTFYCPENMDKAQEQENLKHDLMLAVHRNELELLFQPKVEAASGRIVGAEALIRWNHPLRGCLTPAEFIPMAEQAMIIPLIDNWVIDATCSQWRQLMDQGFPMVPVSVNLSHQKFYQANLPQIISEALRVHNIAPKMLTMELSEDSALINTSKALDIISSLRAQGLSVSIDDFGAGFASLTRLRGLPVDEVKLDPSLVSDNSSTASDSLRSLVHLVKVYSARVVFEGVETSEQFARAAEAGGDHVQGYYTGRPMTAEELAELIANQQNPQSETNKNIDLLPLPALKN